MSNKFFIEPDKIKLFIPEQDDVAVKGRKWSQHVSIYLNELIRRTFQDEDALPQKYHFALLVVTPRLLQNPDELKEIQEKVKEWQKEATVIYLLKEPITQFSEKGYQVRLYTIDQESNLVFSEEEIFEKGKIQHFLARISDVLYSIIGILTEDTELIKEGIYLAESDDSQEPLRQLIRKELLRSGFYVFPDKSHEEDLLQEKLKQAILTIHFFGRNLETKKNVLGDLSSHFDNRVAVLALKQRNDARRLQPSIKPLKRIIWIPEIGSIKNEKQEKWIDELKKNPSLNEGAEFYWGSTEVLKEAILEALRSQVTNRVVNTAQVQLQQMVARKDNAMKYSDSKKSGEQERYKENPGDPDSNAEKHAQEDALHTDAMHWLRPDENFRPTQNDLPVEKKTVEGEKKEYLVELNVTKLNEEVLISSEALILKEDQSVEENQPVKEEETQVKVSIERIIIEEVVTLNTATETTSDKKNTE